MPRFYRTGDSVRHSQDVIISIRMYSPFKLVSSFSLFLYHTDDAVPLSPVDGPRPSAVPAIAANSREGNEGMVRRAMKHAHSSRNGAEHAYTMIVTVINKDNSVITIMASY